MIEPPVVRNFIPDSLTLLLFAGLIDGVEPGIGLIETFRQIRHFLLVIIADKDSETFVSLLVLHALLHELTNIAAPSQ